MSNLQVSVECMAWLRLHTHIETLNHAFKTG